MSLMSSFGSVWQYIVETPYRFDSDVAPIFFEEYSDVLQIVCVSYILIVLTGPAAMASRPPFRMDGVIRVWNLLLTIFSALGSVSCVKMMGFLIRSRSFYDITCCFDYSVAYDGAYAFWVFAFMVSKVPEMLDTVFLVLQKKPVALLHFYHHLTVTIFSWHAGRSLLPSGLWFATMNFIVHSIMYWYYFMCSCGMRRAVKPLAPLITLSQILQMILGFGICLYTAYFTYLSPRGCAVNHGVVRMGLIMYGSYFVLFVLFFIKRYSKPTPRRARRAD